MAKKCECLPNADKIADEIKTIAFNTRLTHMKQDADYITGMLFTIGETGFIKEFDEFEELVDSAKRMDRERFGKAADDAARKIEKISC